MKLQLGLLHLDQRLATPCDSETLLAELGQRPAETVGEIADGCLLMAYRGDRITAEEDSDIQPLRLGPYILTWDGRVDNREELADRIGLGDLGSVSDPAIVLKAYDIVGDRIFADIIGEFALVLWCSRTKSLQFVRSACGARPLYYVIARDTLTWSSDFAHLVRVTGVDLAVNDNYVVEYLVSQPSAKTTPLAKVDVVPPNHHVHFKEGRLTRTRELWNPTCIAALHYRTDGEYEEHLRKMIEEAVRVRLRAKHPVFAELSGGLDSSTIVLMADQILRSQNRSPGDLQTTSCVYEQSETCDERPFIRAVEEQRGADSLVVHEQDQRITLGLDDPQFTGVPNALHCFPGRYQTVAALMRPYNARVLLTGRGGDHLFWSEADGTPIVADELRKANPFGAHSECRTWSRAANAPYFELLFSGALPLAFESLFPGRSRYKQPKLPTWLHPKRQGHSLSSNSAFDGYTTWRGAPSRRAQVFFVEHMCRYLGSGFLQEYDDLYFSHPYSHRPLIELCLATPVSQFVRDGQTRSLMRRAMHELLPGKIAKRASKGLLDEGITRALKREWHSVLGIVRWQVCEREYVTNARLMAALNQARLGILGLTGPLLRLFSMERWLRSLSCVQSAKTRERASSASCTRFLLKFEQS
jgi:asparagine synthase (glutamine-hydrolysing)